jgi:hypothetical protein
MRSKRGGSATAKDISGVNPTGIRDLFLYNAGITRRRQAGGGRRAVNLGVGGSRSHHSGQWLSTLYPVVVTALIRCRNARPRVERVVGLRLEVMRH